MTLGSLHRVWKRGKTSKPSERHFYFLSLECFLEMSLLAYGSWGEGEGVWKQEALLMPFLLCDV